MDRADEVDDHRVKAFSCSKDVRIRLGLDYRILTLSGLGRRKRSSRFFLDGGAVVESMLWVGVRLCIDDDALEEASLVFLPAPGMGNGKSNLGFLADSVSSGTS